MNHKERQGTVPNEKRLKRYDKKMKYAILKWNLNQGKKKL